MMTLDELIRSIHDLGSYLKKFEEKYRINTSHPTLNLIVFSPRA